MPQLLWKATGDDAYLQQSLRAAVFIHTFFAAEKAAASVDSYSITIPTLPGTFWEYPFL
jgi:hypothetical protein